MSVDPAPTSKTAKIAYAPVGIVVGMVSGRLAGKLFTSLWGKVRAGEDAAPGPRSQRAGWAEVLLAAAVQGAVYSTVRAAVDRLGATGFERATGEWPGDG